MIYGDWIDRRAKSDPDAEAIVDIPRNRRYTYGQLSAEINRMVHFLSAKLSLRKGDRVAVLAFNRADYIALFFAASRIGAILVPLNFRLTVEEFVYFFEDASPRAFFFDAEHLETAEKLRAKVKVDHFVCLDADDEVGISLPSVWDQLSAAPPAEIELAADDPQLIIYTSGTTGLPKGVLLTYGMITWNAVNTIIGWGFKRGERTILHSALFYTAGWNVFTLPLFYHLGTNVIVHRFDADLVLDLIEKERITVFFAVPTMYQMMIESPRFSGTDFSRVWFMVSGAAPLSEKIFNTFKKEKDVHLREGYGLTEVGPNTFMANGKLKTVGHPMPHADIRLVDDAGQPVPPGQDGEVLIRGGHVCAGYWNKPEETKKTIIDGWFHTGDLARVDGDGHFAIVGRKKDMFISGGINVYPAEVERIIETHPDVAAAAVIGVADEKWGEVGKACLQLKPGKRLTVADLAAFLSGKTAKYKIPKYAVLVDSLPRTVASEKVQKFILKQRHGQPDNR